MIARTSDLADKSEVTEAGDYRCYALFNAPIGHCALCWTERGVCEVHLAETSKARLHEKMRAQAVLHRGDLPPHITTAIGHILAQLAGKPAPLAEVALDIAASGFTRRVYEELQQLPPGQTISYGELAARAGSDGGARAVGRAMATNPVPLLVPCHRVVTAAGKLGGFSAHGGVATKRQLLELEGAPLLSKPAKAVRATRDPLFGGRRPLPFDAKKAVASLKRADADFAPWLKRVGPCMMRLRPARTTFEALAESIVYQQLNGKAAGSIYARLHETLAGTGRMRPKQVLSRDHDTLRGCGLSNAKALALRDLAERTQAGTIPSLRALEKLPDDAIVESLTQVRGIGAWTVHMLLMFQLGRPDVVASGDYGLRKGLGRVLGSADLPSPKAFVERTERWAPYRSVASWYLWRITELKDGDT